MVGQHRLRGCAGRRGARGSIPAVAVDESGDPGVGCVGDVQRALATGSRPPTCRWCRRPVPPARTGTGRGRRCRGWRPAWWPRRWGRSGSRRPGARGRCRPSAGPASPARDRPACPVARSHTRVEARWLAMPTAATGPPSARLCDGHLEHGRGDGRAVELDQTGERGVGEHRDVVDVLHGGVGADHRAPHPRGADVDDEDAHGQGTGAERGGQAELAGIEDAVGVEGRLDRGEDVERAAEAVGQEAAPVESDAVVVADGPAGRQGGPGHLVPRPAVVVGRSRRPRPAGIRGDVPGRPAGEGEVEAGAVGVGVALVGRGDQGARHRCQRVRARRRTGRAGPPTGPTPRRCRRRCRPATAGPAPRRRCGGSSHRSTRPTSRAVRAGALLVDDVEGGAHQCRVGLVQHDQHVGVGPRRRTVPTRSAS